MKNLFGVTQQCLESNLLMINTYRASWASFARNSIVIGLCRQLLIASIGAYSGDQKYSEKKMTTSLNPRTDHYRGACLLCGDLCHGRGELVSEGSHQCVHLTASQRIMVLDQKHPNQSRRGVRSVSFNSFWHFFPEVLGDLRYD